MISKIYEHNLQIVHIYEWPVSSLGADKGMFLFTILVTAYSLTSFTESVMRASSVASVAT